MIRLIRRCACILPLFLAAFALASDPPRQKTLPAFGISYIPPGAGWTEQTPETLNEIITWTAPKKAGEVQSAITLRCEPATGALDANATDLALQFNGAVLDEKAVIDGEPAKVIWVTRQGVTAELRAVVTQHAGLVYIAECSGPAGALPRVAFDQLVMDLRWAKLDELTDHLNQDGPRMTIMGGKLSIQRPDIMRPMVPADLQKPDRFLFMTARSKGNDAEFICAVGLSTAVSARPFAEMASAYLNQLNTQNPDAKVQWQLNDPLRRLSNLVIFKKTDPTGTVRDISTIAGIAQIDGISQYVVVNYLVNVGDPAKRKAYEAAARKIFDSIKAAGGK